MNNHIASVNPLRGNVRRKSFLPGRPAYSLIEVVITVLTMGIVAAAASFRIGDSITRHQLQAAAQRIAADIEWARKSARSSGQTRTVTFDIAANRYSIPGLTDPDRRGQAYVVDLSTTGYSASLTAIALGSAGTANAITFDLFGRPDAGGSIVVALGTHQRTITIDATTGLATVN